MGETLFGMHTLLYSVEEVKTLGSALFLWEESSVVEGGFGTEYCQPSQSTIITESDYQEMDEEHQTKRSLNYCFISRENLVKRYPERYLPATLNIPPAKLHLFLQLPTTVKGKTHNPTIPLSFELDQVNSIGPELGSKLLEPSKIHSRSTSFSVKLCRPSRLPPI